MLNLEQLKECVITPALSELQMYSSDAVELLIFTCAVESDGGTFIKQIKGPALGVYQMEPSTHQDIWVNYIFNSSRLMSILGANFDCPRIPDASRLMYDIRYATVMARLLYSRFHEPLPSAEDPKAMFDYYKKYFNTSLGKSKQVDSIKKYKNFIS